jgi:hypothetical protein
MLSRSSAAHYAPFTAKCLGFLLRPAVGCAASLRGFTALAGNAALLGGVHGSKAPALGRSANTRGGPLLYPDVIH